LYHIYPLTPFPYFPPTHCYQTLILQKNEKEIFFLVSDSYTGSFLVALPYMYVCVCMYVCIIAQFGSFPLFFFFLL
jgi:hypothetical protein